MSIPFSRACLRATCLAFAMLLAGCSDGGGADDSIFDFFVLSLSWSPSHCALAGERASAEQCEADVPAGFVVHGLWPQFESGYPEYCPAGQMRAPSRSDLDAARRILPTMELARHQWRKHGGCTGLSPAAYFAATAAARDRVRIPDGLLPARRERRLAPHEVERAFLAANPGLTHDAIAVSCSGRMLREVRICLSQDFTFRPCPEVDRRGCRSGPLLMPAASP